MLLKSPYQKISKKGYPRLLLISGFFSFALLIVINRVDLHLKSGVTPHGIISFELASSPDASLQMMQAWDAEAKMYAAFSLGIDYLFIISYALFLSLLCMLLANKFTEKRFLLNMGILIGYGLWLAAALDALENFALFQLLFGNTNSVYTIIASTSAAIKFLLVLLSFIYLAAGGIILLKDRILTNN